MSDDKEPILIVAEDAEELSDMINTLARKYRVYSALDPMGRKEVLDLIAKGLDNDEIAGHLCISPKTVRNHITRIFNKLQVNTRARAIVLAREAGIGQEM